MVSMDYKFNTIIIACEYLGCYVMMEMHYRIHTYIIYEEYSEIYTCYFNIDSMHFFIYKYNT